MIRQLPKLTAPSFVRDLQSNTAALSEGAEVKHYDIITESTTLNSEGNTMQLELFQRDSEQFEGERELHGRLVLNTTRLPESQELTFGFAFAESEKKDFFDGLQVVTRVNNPWKQYTARDITSGPRPDIFGAAFTFKADKNADWLLREAESTSTCDSAGKCEFSVVFVRNFSTGDSADDISLLRGEERQYALTGFYKALGKDERITHIGQSQDMNVLMGAFDSVAASSFITIAALLTLTSF
mmetsp:Transcript_36952/g.48605  ORF Transcript_36952/g.48605 Transcript_36952/m.48605 type:complete len:241 (+) Transcript_36952:54-776(+)|eukprot:CAMPEP_0185581944 /NCGR_PEP_ID=MMETSP0434-20130131/19402_1 /TAXON_ID=626734 ORGANISM="Favella taraikaensis, Strain Fe Narragansett Bay" /NCGR_SAMPLE_ID=MMETSP0434 /ASSEMBLY_ACC=CAM_ASM_000379 /LENGTH=240 /DNA_ID=CAMNT_0028200613 /DNA_START=54 /DNA_END=776 /DNA_ORIENTATION=-